MTDRDVEMVQWIAEQNVVRFDPIHSLMNRSCNPINKSLVYALCDKCYRLGFIKKQKLLGNTPELNRLTGKFYSATANRIFATASAAIAPTTVLLAGSFFVFL